MGLSSWTILSTGATPPSLSFSGIAIAGTTSLILDSQPTDVGTKIVRHNTFGNSAQGKIRTLFSIGATDNGATFGLFGMLQSPGTAATDSAYWCYFKRGDLGNLRLAKCGANALDTTTPLASGTIGSALVASTIYALELEWQYDSANAATILYGRFATGTNFGALVAATSIVDVASPYTGSVSAGLGLNHVNAGSADPAFKLDSTFIFAP